MEYDNDTGPGDDAFWEWWAIPGFGKFDSEADAELTRRAVNSFEAMRKALTLAYREIRFGSASNALDEVEKALKLANGEGE